MQKTPFFATYFFAEGSVSLQVFPIRLMEHRKHYWIRDCLNWCCFSEEKKTWLSLSSLRKRLALEQ